MDEQPSFASVLLFGRDPQRFIPAAEVRCTRYIEKYGTGTLMMIRACRDYGLPEPGFEQRGGEFVVTLWRDRFTGPMLEAFGLNDRQIQGVTQIKQTGRITNLEYQRLTGANRKTAARDLNDLVAKGVLQRLGEKRGTYYALTRG